jgi:hypothetical protein
LESLGSACPFHIGSIAILEAELDRVLDVAHLSIKSTIHALAEQGLKKRQFGHRLRLGFPLSLLVRRCSFGVQRSIRLRS